MFKIWEFVDLSWGREIIEFSRGPAEARSRKAAGRKLDLRALWVLWPSPPPHPAGLVRLSYDNPGPPVTPTKASYLGTLAGTSPNPIRPLASHHRGSPV